MPRSLRRSLPRRAVAVALLLLVAAAVLAIRGAVVAASDPDAPAPTGLRVDGLETPADLGDLTSPGFSWRVPGREQAAYRVVVSSSAAKAAAHEGDVWDSGRVASARQTDVPYGGDTLARERRYWWSVRTWSADGHASDWSAATWFGTAPGTEWSDSAPIWTPGTVDAADWTDYTLTAKVKITAVALGVRFRAADNDTSYMWQLRGDNNTLQKHVQQKGTYTSTGSVALPSGTLAVGKTVDLRITVEGSTLRTWIDGTLVDTTTDATIAKGTFGFRTGRTEAGEVDDLKVVAADGRTLLQSDFSGANPLGCGTVQGGVLTVGNNLTCGPANRPWAFFRTQERLQDKPIAWATAFATGVDFTASKQYVYKLAVNGRFVGLGPTHEVADETRFDGFDVTDLLRRGEDVTVAAQAYSRAATPKFQAELHVAYADGTTQTIGTGDGWKALDGSQALPEAGSIGTSYFTAPKENLDLTRFPAGFDRNGFDDAAWPAAQEMRPIPDLQPTPTGKVQEQLRDPVRIVDKGDGTYFVDFGRTWIGGVQYDIANGQAGKTVDIRFGEVPTETGGSTVKYQLNTGNTYQDVATLKDGAQQVKTWGARVFRYVEIRNAPEKITKDNLKALALVYPFDEKTATFASSDDRLNQVYDLSKNTIEALNLNFYTDSWTRERTNYEADAYLQQLSSLYLMEDLSLGRYSMNYFKGNRTWPTEWPIYVVLAVHDAWRQTGNVEQVEDYYADLQKKLRPDWLEASTGLVRKDQGSNGCSSQTDCDIVDWPTSQRDGFVFRPYNTVINAIYYRGLRDMAAMATAIGRDDDAADYTAQADRLREQINAKLYDPETGRYDDGLAADGTTRTGHASLHASAFALAFGVPEQDQAKKVADYVASRGMACSVYCAAFVVKGLYDGGNGEAALKALTDEGKSSWMNMIRLGAGSTMEAWDPSQKSNLTYSHPWAASPAFNVPSGLFGIQPIEAGYETFRVRPQPGSLDHARATVPTVKGTIGAAFDHGDGGALRVAADVPGNTRADVAVPTDADGEVVLYVDGTPRRVTAKDGFATAEGLTTGCHVVTTEPGEAALREEALTGVCARAPRVPEEPTVPAPPSDPTTPSPTPPT
ncbi:family 78 glycoside hydrolase catalytic domain, partial [Patulibacter sp. S7RM1-6]